MIDSTIRLVTTSIIQGVVPKKKITEEERSQICQIVDLCVRTTLQTIYDTTQNQPGLVYRLIAQATDLMAKPQAIGQILDAVAIWQQAGLLQTAKLLS